MQPPDRGSALFNFGTALFATLPPAASSSRHSKQTAEPPDSWRVLLISKHASPALRLAVFRSCRAGRQWVLQSSPSASLYVDLTMDMSDSARAIQQRAILQALILRGKLPTRLRVRFGARQVHASPSAPPYLASSQRQRPTSAY